MDKPVFYVYNLSNTVFSYNLAKEDGNYAVDIGQYF
jgi:hypothetical protein